MVTRRLDVYSSNHNRRKAQESIMIKVICQNEVLTFASVEEIQAGLKKRGLKLLAAIEAAGRYPYPSDHEEERADIADEIYLIGSSTESTDTWKQCVASLWRLDTQLCAQLQVNPPSPKVSPFQPEAPTESQMRDARRTYPYSEVG